MSKKIHVWAKTSPWSYSVLTKTEGSLYRQWLDILTERSVLPPEANLGNTNLLLSVQYSEQLSSAGSCSGVLFDSCRRDGFSGHNHGLLRDGGCNHQRRREREVSGRKKNHSLKPRGCLLSSAHKSLSFATFARHNPALTALSHPVLSPLLLLRRRRQSSCPR